MKRFSLTFPFLILLISCDKPQREVVVEKWDDGTPSKVNFVVGEGLKQEIVGRMTFYENGVIQTKEEYRENKNNQKEIIIVITPHIIDVDNKDFTRLVPKDAEIFQSLDNMLFKNNLPIRLKFYYFCHR